MAARSVAGWSGTDFSTTPGGKRPTRATMMVGFLEASLRMLPLWRSPCSHGCRGSVLECGGRDARARPLHRGHRFRSVEGWCGLGEVRRRDVGGLVVLGLGFGESGVALSLPTALRDASRRSISLAEGGAFSSISAMSDTTDRLSWPHAPVHRLTELGIYFGTAESLPVMLRKLSHMLDHQVLP